MAGFRGMKGKRKEGRMEGGRDQREVVGKEERMEERVDRKGQREEQRDLI